MRISQEDMTKGNHVILWIIIIITTEDDSILGQNFFIMQNYIITGTVE